MKKTAIFVFSILSCLALKAQVKLPALFRDHMVLQQKSRVLFWGSAPPGSHVLIRPGWTGKTYSTRVADDGRWKTRISTPSAGGPYQIDIASNGKHQKIQDVLLGEVWLCSGQSNMEMPLKGYRNQPVLHATSIIDSADTHPRIHIFRVPKVMALTAQNDCDGRWFISTSQNAPDFSAIAYQYAAMLQDSLHVPVGILESYWGGTSIQSWMNAKTLRKVAGVEIAGRLDTIKNPETDPENTPTLLYNAMIAPIAGYTIRGFIWYQGASNRDHPLLYRRLQPAMVKQWRQVWGEGMLPFYFVQIAPYGYWDPEHKLYPAIVRESQLKAWRKIPRSGLVISLDAGKQKFIHPPDKTVISHRLILWALEKTYHHKQLIAEGPTLRKVKMKNGKAILRFSQSGGALLLKNGADSLFEIAGKDKVFYPARITRYDDHTLVVESPQVKSPASVRYAFRNWVEGTVFNQQGLPASSFRTDQWKKVSYGDTR